MVIAAHSDDLPIDFRLGLQCQKLAVPRTLLLDVVVLLAPCLMFGSEVCKAIGNCSLSNQLAWLHSGTTKAIPQAPQRRECVAGGLPARSIPSLSVRTAAGVHTADDDG